MLVDDHPEGAKDGGVSHSCWDGEGHKEQRLAYSRRHEAIDWGQVEAGKQQKVRQGASKVSVGSGHGLSEGGLEEGSEINSLVCWADHDVGDGLWGELASWAGGRAVEVGVPDGQVNASGLSSIGSL